MTPVHHCSSGAPGSSCSRCLETRNEAFLDRGWLYHFDIHRRTYRPRSAGERRRYRQTSAKRLHEQAHVRRQRPFLQRCEACLQGTLAAAQGHPRIDQPGRRRREGSLASTFFTAPAPTSTRRYRAWERRIDLRAFAPCPDQSPHPYPPFAISATPP